MLAKSFWFLPQKMSEKKWTLFFSSWGKKKADKTAQLKANVVECFSLWFFF